MSRVFYDHLVKFEKLEIFVSTVSENHEEKHELWEVIDKLTHTRIINKLLHLLPTRHHEEFTVLLHERPYDKRIIKFLNEFSEVDIEAHLKNELENFENELLKELLEDES